jgi:ferrous iron transport protein B
MELPPYRLPTLRGLLIHMWERGWMYLRKAGTVILAFSIVMWAATRYPRLPASAESGNVLEQPRAAMQYSLAGRAGRWMEPVLRPIGFDWKIGTALIGATVAKEMFVSQMSIVYSLGGEEDLDHLRSHLQADYSRLQGFCIMLFLSGQRTCIATVAVTRRRESGSWKWALCCSFGGLTCWPTADAGGLSGGTASEPVFSDINSAGRREGRTLNFRFAANKSVKIVSRRYLQTNPCSGRPACRGSWGR